MSSSNGRDVGDSAPAPVSLGALIDGYRHLSDSDKRIFNLACQLEVANNATTSAAGTSPAAPGPGLTREPKTGKVFKITPKKEKSPERIALEKRLSSAKQNFTKVLRDHNIILSDDGVPSLEGVADPLRAKADVVVAYNVAAEAAARAKQALNDYKNSHPEEFTAPPVKGGKQPPPKPASRPILPWPGTVKPSPGNGEGPSRDGQTSPKGKGKGPLGAPLAPGLGAVSNMETTTTTVVGAGPKGPIEW
jgi:hypothetical protein